MSGCTRPSRASLVIFWNSFRTCQRSSGVPSSRQNTRSDCHASPAASRSAAWRGRWARSAWAALVGSFSTRLLLRVLVSPLTRTGRYTATVPTLRSTSSPVIARAFSVRTRPVGAVDEHASQRLGFHGGDVLLGVALAVEGPCRILAAVHRRPGQPAAAGAVPCCDNLFRSHQAARRRATSTRRRRPAAECPLPVPACAEQLAHP